MKQFLKTGIIGLGILGLIGVSKISLLHWTKESFCPMLGIFPACYIIFIAYAMIILSMFFPYKKQEKVFLFSWLPIIILASIGSLGELTNLATCPHTNTGIPKCYLSAFLSIVIGILAWFYFKKKYK